MLTSADLAVWRPQVPESDGPIKGARDEGIVDRRHHKTHHAEGKGGREGRREGRGWAWKEG